MAHVYSPPIDLRSDTVTRPTAGMRAAMAAAEVGDDVYGEDPTVRRLEERVADFFGKEAALFVPSGTMANQIAVKVHCRPADELIADENSHLVLWEQGGPAALSGVTCRPVRTPDGVLTPDLLSVKPDEAHAVRTRLVCLENTHNRCGGNVYPHDTFRAVAAWAHRHGLIVHLDGARLWNAVVATGVGGRGWAAHVDTLNVCFSKGLGAPVGSAVVGSTAFVREARRARKLLGGGMRQAGVLAAACLYALDHHLDRLADDHAHARLLASAVADTPGLTPVPPTPHTNLVWCDVDPALGTGKDVAARLKARGVLASAPGTGQAVRVVTHLDVSRSDVERAAEVIRRHAAG